MLSLSEDNQSDVIEAFNSTSRYLDDLLNSDNNFFDNMVNRIYPSELSQIRPTCQIPRPHFWIYIYLYRIFVKTKIYDKRDDFDFDIVNFPFLDGDVPRSTSYGIYISQLIRFARVSSHVDNFNIRNKVLTVMYFKKTILQNVMFAKSYHTINVCIFSSYIRASFMQIQVVLVQLASCCCLNTIHNMVSETAHLRPQ